MEIHIGNRVAEVELKSKEGNKVLLTIDGKEFEVDITIVENGYCSILHEGKSYNAELIRSENGRVYKVSTRPIRWRLWIHKPSTCVCDAKMKTNRIIR